MHIGQRLKALVKQRRIATKTIAEHCEVSVGAVSNWFATGRITKENLLKVSEYLGVRMDEIVAGTVGERLDPPPKPHIELSSAEIDLVEAFRDIPESRQLEVLEELRTTAAGYREMAEKILRDRYGVTGFVTPERAAAVLPQPPAPPSRGEPPKPNDKPGGGKGARRSTEPQSRRS